MNGESKNRIELDKGLKIRLLRAIQQGYLDTNEFPELIMRPILNIDPLNDDYFENNKDLQK